MNISFFFRSSGRNDAERGCPRSIRLSQPGVGYVACRQPGESGEEMMTSEYHIDVAGRKIRAETHLRPIYDPKSQRVRM